MKGSKFVIGIGAQKAGTTWLSMYLDSHPDVCFSPRKEIHFFDSKYIPEICGNWEIRLREEKKTNPIRKRLKWLVKTGVGRNSMTYHEFLDMRMRMMEDEALYLEYFNRINRGQRYNAEISPSYCLMGRDGFEAMKSLLGDVKIIFIMRNPADRYWSNMKHLHQKDSNFDVIRDYRSRLDNPRNVLRNDYSRTIELLDNIFPEQDILYLFYEYLFQGDDTQVYFRRIPKFLGIDPGNPNLGKAVNRSTSKLMPPVVRKELIDNMRPVYEYIFKRFGEVPDSWQKDMGFL